MRNSYIIVEPKCWFAVLQHLNICHVLDMMHCEKNLCKNIVRTLMGKNDHARGQEDMKDMGIREQL
jgi:hypothetical protein